MKADDNQLEINKLYMCALETYILLLLQHINKKPNKPDINKNSTHTYKPSKFNKKIKINKNSIFKFVLFFEENFVLYDMK